MTKTNDEINAAVDELLGSKTPKEVAALLDQRDNLRLHKEEHAKVHLLSHVECSDEEVAAFAAHMLDGGGVRADELALDGGPSLRGRFHTALREDPREALHLLPHLVKSLMKRTAMTTALRGGGVASGMTGSARVPAAAEVAHAAKRDVKAKGERNEKNE